MVCICKQSLTYFDRLNKEEDSSVFVEIFWNFLTLAPLWSMGLT